MHLFNHMSRCSYPIYVYCYPISLCCYPYFQLLAEKNEHIRGALHQIWKEQQRKALLLKSVEWTPVDWLEARIHFEPIIIDELRQCAECFIDLYENGYSNFDSEEGRFDFTEGCSEDLA